jgi:UDP-N-acetylmuramoylalanine--D-glutamate ligase
VHVRSDDGAAQSVVAREDVPLLGAFQLENVMAASLAAAWLGAAPADIGAAVAAATPLEHRLQLSATIDGVAVYDNGVSTEVESTRQALEGLERPGVRVHWLGGGKSKDGDHGKVARAVARSAASAHVFGAAAAPFAAQMAGAIPTTAHVALRDALVATLAGAAPGDAVLFSPAFASFDQYPNFRARAAEFQGLLRERRAADHEPG